MTERKRFRKAVPSFALVICFFIGTATGYYYNDLSAGILIGLGSGFIVMSVLRMVLKRTDSQKMEPPNRDGEDHAE